MAYGSIEMDNYEWVDIWTWDSVGWGVMRLAAGCWKLLVCGWGDGKGLKICNYSKVIDRKSNMLLLLLPDSYTNFLG